MSVSERAAKRKASVNNFIAPVRDKIVAFSRGFDNVGGSRFVVAGLLLGLIALPLDPAKDEILVLTGFFALAALGLNVVVGLAGLLDLGYVAFFAIGAYTVGMLTESNATVHPAILAPWIVLPIAILVAMIAGLLLGTPTLRLRGDYLAIVTLGFHEITRQTVKNLEVVNGARGLFGIPHPDVTFDGVFQKVAGLILIAGGAFLVWSAWRNTQRARARERDRSQLGTIGNFTALALVGLIGLAIVLFGLFKMLFASEPLVIEFGVLEPQNYWFIISAFIVVALYLINQLKDSRIGRAWEAIREDEVAAGAMGIPVVKFKLYAFAIGASTSGLAGWALATKVGFINPNTFPLLYSILVLCAVVIGGIGSSAGALLGAAIVFGLPELLRDFAGEDKIFGFDILTGRIAIFGLLLVIMMIFRPGGFISSARRRAELGGGIHDDVAGSEPSIAASETATRG
jgi:branched-chain amino acid transport system permease protein